jgi:membrane-bound serine protease (ClpP class)
VPGVVGGVSLLLAFFALQLLPVNFAGVLLILLGLGLFALEIKVTSYGLLTVAGIISLTFGSMILIDSESPELRVSLSFVVPVVVGFAGIATMLIRLGVAAQRQRPVTGDAGMVGQAAVALTAITPEHGGRVTLRGEIWQARADEPIGEGSRVHVTGIDGLVVTVRRE